MALRDWRRYSADLSGVSVPFVCRVDCLGAKLYGRSIRGVTKGSGNKSSEVCGTAYRVTVRTCYSKDLSVNVLHPEKTPCHLEARTPQLK